MINGLHFESGVHFSWFNYQGFDMEAKSPLYDHILEQIKNTVLQFFEDEDVIVLLFGSSASGDFHRYSDIDIGILPRDGYNKKKLILLRERLENMTEEEREAFREQMRERFGGRRPGGDGQGGREGGRRRPGGPRPNSEQ